MIYFLVSTGECSSVSLVQILYTAQRVIKVIQIVAPILLLVMASIHLFSLMRNPDDKKRLPKIRNSFLAAAIIFFIPMIGNVIMNWLDSSFDFAACWNDARSGNLNPGYVAPYNDSRDHSQAIIDPSEYEPGNPKRNLNVSPGVSQGQSGNMTYNLYIPPNPTTNMPLLIWLHGDGGSGSAAEPLGNLANRAGIAAIVVAPTSPGLGSSGNPGWYEGNHLGEVKQILDEVCEKYQCDKENINIGGHSRGAIGTWMMVSAYPGVFHAAAPISCCKSSGFKAESFTGVKVWAMRGSGAGSGSGNDDIYGSCMQSSVNAIKPYAKAWKYTILPNTTHGGAGSNAISNKEMIEFIFSD